ncbi:hypothetical protein ACIPYQ_41080 [Streptomyces sp. NPDC090045]|uniref:hypothetical protein n=1 Tax=Streptomyces sp. NPDC090045 TaxID=3365927 RepID=UPI0038004619
MQGESTQFGRVVIVITEVTDPRAAALRLVDAAAPRYELRLVCPRLAVQVEHLRVGLLDRFGPGVPRAWALSSRPEGPSPAPPRNRWS